MGVDIGHRRLKLLAAMWGAIIMTALADLTEEDGIDWANIGIDDIVARTTDVHRVHRRNRRPPAARVANCLPRSGTTAGMGLPFEGRLPY